MVDMDNPTTIEWAFKSLVVGVAAAGGWMWKRLAGDIRDNEKKLREHELYSERSFAKDVNVQNSLSRIHDRMDVISDDIKQILGKL